MYRKTIKKRKKRAIRKAGRDLQLTEKFGIRYTEYSDEHTFFILEIQPGPDSLFLLTILRTYIQAWCPVLCAHRGVHK